MPMPPGGKAGLQKCCSLESPGELSKLLTPPSHPIQFHRAQYFWGCPGGPNGQQHLRATDKISSPATGAAGSSLSTCPDLPSLMTLPGPAASCTWRTRRDPISRGPLMRPHDCKAALSPAQRCLLPRPTSVDPARFPGDVLLKTLSGCFLREPNLWSHTTWNLA